MTTQYTDEMREAFERNERAIGNNVVRDGCLYQCDRMTHRWLGYQDGITAATAAADEKYLPVIEKLVGAIPAAQKATKMQCYIDEYPEPTGNDAKRFYAEKKESEALVEEALTEAAPLLKGGK